PDPPGPGDGVQGRVARRADAGPSLEELPDEDELALVAPQDCHMHRAELRQGPASSTAGLGLMRPSAMYGSHSMFRPRTGCVPRGVPPPLTPRREAVRGRRPAP